MDIVSTVLVLGFFLTCSRELDKLIDKRPKFKNEIVTTIKKFSSANIQEIVINSNRIFINIFKLIFEVESIDRNQQYRWMWLICSFSISLFTGLFLYLSKMIIPLENLLAYLLIIPSGFVFMLFIIKEYLKRMSLLFFLIWYITFVFFIVITIFLLGFNLLNINFNLLITIILVITGSMMIGILFFICLKIWGRSFLYISPPRVIFTSILLMTIIAFIKKDITQTFFYDLNQIGLILLAYLFLNILADSISLCETNFILRLAVKGTTKRFVFLGLIDLILTTFIFLAIPLSTGNLDTFLESMLFKGDNPWLGILFWSTFSTSIIFWAFLLAIFGQIVAQKVLGYYIKLNKILPIEEKPFTCLYFIDIVIIMPFVLVI